MVKRDVVKRTCFSFWSAVSFSNYKSSKLHYRPTMGQNLQIFTPQNVVDTDTPPPWSALQHYITFQWKSVKSILTKKISLGFPVLATMRTMPNICQGQPQAMYPKHSRFHTNQFTFGGVIPKRANTIKTGRKVFAIFGWSIALSRIIKINLWLCTIVWASEGPSFGFWQCPWQKHLCILHGCYYKYYTVNHKKRGSLFLTITLANLNRFL